MLDCFIDLLGKFLAAANLCGQKFAEGNFLASGPRLRLPQLRADEGLGAVEETLTHGNPYRQQRRRAASTEPNEQARIVRQLRGPVDAKGLVSAGHEKNNSDLRIGQNVPQTEHQSIALPFRDQERAIVFDDNEARAVALG